MSGMVKAAGEARIDRITDLENQTIVGTIVGVIPAE